MPNSLGISCALTAIVVSGYVGIVGLLGKLFEVQGNIWISLIVTGLVAVLFQPLRERVQHGVNRVMYGERDAPYTVLTRLSRRLGAAMTPDMILPMVIETIAQALKLPYVAIETGRGARTGLAAAFGRFGRDVTDAGAACPAAEATIGDQRDFIAKPHAHNC